jgi:ABC-type transporter Mla maintaining outer membrane lipid asymmetry ATPase subunit MlaF
MAEASTHAGTGPVISVRDVVVSYNGRRVLDGINLDISRGETRSCWEVAGPGKARSCGKSSGWSIRNPAGFS